MKVSSFKFEMKQDSCGKYVEVQVEYKFKGKTYLFMEELTPKEFSNFVVRFHDGESKFIKYIHIGYWEE